MLARLRPFLPTAVLFLLIVYFTLNAFSGDRGLLASNQRDETLIAQTRAALMLSRSSWFSSARVLGTNAAKATIPINLKEFVFIF